MTTTQSWNDSTAPVRWPERGTERAAERGTAPATAERRAPDRWAEDERRDRPDPWTSVVRRWWLVLLVGVLGAAVVGAGAFARDPRWTSETELAVASDDPVGAIAPDGGSGADASPAELAGLLGSDAVVTPVAQQLGLSPAALRAMLDVQPSDDAGTITVLITASGAARASEVATALANAAVGVDQAQGQARLTGQADALEPAAAGLAAQVDALPPGAPAATPIADRLAAVRAEQARMRAAAAVYPGRLAVARAATPPAEPDGLDVPTSVALGGAVGLATGAMLAVAIGARPARRRRGAAGRR